MFVVFAVYILAVYLNVLVVKTMHTMKAQKEATLVGLCKSSEISGGQCCVEKYFIHLIGKFRINMDQMTRI